MRKDAAFLVVGVLRGCEAESGRALAVSTARSPPSINCASSVAAAGSAGLFWPCNRRSMRTSLKGAAGHPIQTGNTRLPAARGVPRCLRSGLISTVAFAASTVGIRRLYKTVVQPYKPFSPTILCPPDKMPLGHAVQATRNAGACKSTGVSRRDAPMNFQIRPPPAPAC